MAPPAAVRQGRDDDLMFTNETCPEGKALKMCSLPHICGYSS